MNDFDSGVTPMARNCLCATKLVRKGEWTVEDMERWLNAVIDSDAEYIDVAKEQIERKMNETLA